MATLKSTQYADTTVRELLCVRNRAGIFTAEVLEASGAVSRMPLAQLVAEAPWHRWNNPISELRRARKLHCWLSKTMPWLSDSGLPNRIKPSRTTS